MRHSNTRVVAATIILFLPCLGAVHAYDDPVIEVTLNLSDGSRVIGVPEFDEFEISTEYGSLTIPARDLSEIYFLGGDLATVKALLGNGDIVHGKSKASVFPVSTQYGKVKIERSFVVSILVRTYAESVDASLVAYYPFDDDAADASGRYPEGDICGPSRIEGRAGNAFRFNGRDAIRFSDPIVHGTPLTIALWFRSALRPRENAYLISNGGQTSTSQGFALFIAGSAHVDYYGYPSDGMGFFVGDQATNFRAMVIHPVAIGKWHHVVATWDGIPGAERMSIFIDGKLVDAVPWTPPGASSFGPVQDLVIGMPSNVSKYGFIGDLDEIRIYDQVLSLAQVQLLYESYQR